MLISQPHLTRAVVDLFRFLDIKSVICFLPYPDFVIHRLTAKLNIKISSEERPDIFLLLLDNCSSMASFLVICVMCKG